MRHLEFLIEDQSGGHLLNLILPQILPDGVTYKVKEYKGIGSIPKNLNAKSDPKTRALLNLLPGLVRGYGNAFKNYPKDYKCGLIIICDLDQKDKDQFEQEVMELIEGCEPHSNAYFCIAVEEGEAWLLGDPDAVMLAYPTIKTAILSSYKFDSICGTWEKLADMVEEGGAAALRTAGYQSIGSAKCRWAQEIGQHLSVERNKSPSFQAFVSTINQFLQ